MPQALYFILHPAIIIFFFPLHLHLSGVRLLSPDVILILGVAMYNVAIHYNAVKSSSSLINKNCLSEIGMHVFFMFKPTKFF